MRKVGSTTDTADSNGEYTNGNVANGVPPTIINAEMLNTFQRELVNAVEGAGIELNPNDDGQLSKAIGKTIKQQSQALLANNGYQKMPSGLIIQWGFVEGTGASSVTANFPIKFPNDLFQSVATMRDMSGGNVEGVSVYSNWISDDDTRKTIIKIGVAGANLGSWGVKYIAIGF